MPVLYLLSLCVSWACLALLVLVGLAILARTPVRRHGGFMLRVPSASANENPVTDAQARTSTGCRTAGLSPAVTVMRGTRLDRSRTGGRGFSTDGRFDASATDTHRGIRTTDADSDPGDCTA